MKRTIIFCLVTLLIDQSSWCAITRTAKGTEANKSGTVLSESCESGFGCDFATGASIVVVISHDPDTVVSVKIRDWVLPTCSGSDIASLVKDVEATNTGNVQTSIWSTHNFAGDDGTSCVELTLTTSGQAKAMAVIELVGANGTLTTGTSSTGTGTGTAGSTGSITCTPNASADCAWIGGVGLKGPDGDDGPDTDAEWNNPDNFDQKLGTTGGSATTNITNYSGYEIDTVAVTQAGDTTWTTSRDWAMAIVNYKEPASGGPGLVLQDIIQTGGLIPVPR